MHMDSIPIQTDGSFSYSGSFSEPGEMQITTRKSTTSIWLDDGIKNIYLSEKPNQNGKLKLTVDSVNGSEDTYLFYYTLLPKTVKTIHTSATNRRFYSEKEMKEFQDSLSKANKPGRDILWTDISFREVDSVFKIRPESKLLPWLIQFYGRILGIDLMQQFYNRLNTEQQLSEAGKGLLKTLSRLHLLKPGNIFSNFTLKNELGKNFKFRSLKSKYVLIDFWASYCGPCRVNHPLLREVYQKAREAGLEVISISLDEDRQKWLNAIEQDKLAWINVSDLKGNESSIVRKYNITGIPFSVLLDENRKVILVNPTPYQLTDFFASLR